MSSRKRLDNHDKSYENPVVQSGREQLKAWIDKRFGGSQRSAVEYLGIPGIDEVVLSKILNTDRRPDLEKLVIIEEKAGIPIRSWASSGVDEAEPVGARHGKKAR